MALTAAQITAVNSGSLWHTLITRVVVDSTLTLRLTNHYKDLRITEADGVTYTYSSDDEARGVPSSRFNTLTNASTTNFIIGLLDPQRRERFLSARNIGARATISRVIIDDTTGEPVGDPLPRVQGVVWGYEIEEDWTQDGTLRAFNAVLDIRPETDDLLTTPNVQTNSASQQRFAMNDDIFSLVEASSNKNVVLI